jgi:thymidylate synthase
VGRHPAVVRSITARCYTSGVKPYLDLVRQVLEHGEERDDRTGTGTLSLFGLSARYDMREGFPLVTTKKVLFPAVVRELLWFLRGSTNVRDGLTQHTPIWDAWAGADGELGPIYGYQWRRWPGRDGQGIDQIRRAIDLIKNDPGSRRILVSAWNVSDLDRMALPPCHTMFQFYVHGRRLDCQLYQRSADLALGVPFNIASYALLTHMIANECGLEPGFFIHVLGDAHVYRNHIAGLREQLSRAPHPLPTLHLPPGVPVDDIRFEDVELRGYLSHPFIKFEVSV